MNRQRLLVAVILVCAFGLVPAAAAAAPAYVALGDSYSSGVGTRTYYNDGTSCDRSPYAYAPLIASDRGYALTFEACSGAKTTDVNNNQLGPLNSGTNLATITIGGNDSCRGYSTPPTLISACTRPTRTSWCSAIRTCSRPTARPATSMR